MNAEIEGWYAAHNCDHAHCPEECEHPQPTIHDGVLLCGRCLLIDGVRTPMIPCSPETCAD